MVLEEHNVGVRHLLEGLVLDDLFHSGYHEAVFAICCGVDQAAPLRLLKTEIVIQQVVEHILLYGVFVSYIIDYLLRGWRCTAVNR